MKKYLISTSILGLALALAAVGPMRAQNATVQSANAQTNQPMQQPESPKHQDIKAFTGMIVKDGSKFVLKDVSSNTAFKVDDEKKVKDYVGKMVKVTGILDQSRNMIRVESVEVVS
jgi:hypothetical protein